MRHDGFVLNVNDGRHLDNQNAYSVRGTIRFEPSKDTTIDLVTSFSKENDDKMRSQKQLCTTDPTGTLGCLPNSLGIGVINPNSTFEYGNAGFE